MLIELRKSAARKIGVAVEVTEAVASASGAAGALLFGRALLAIALGAIATGIFLRLKSRRGAGKSVQSVHVPFRASATALGLSVMEGAVLVEATDLPVRFSQPGFALHHWVLVLVFLAVAFFIQRRALAGWRRRHGPPAP